ncbi:hypothetical protein BH11BAC7_BH11BAC7_16190 [soil metagenome]
MVPLSGPLKITPWFLVTPLRFVGEGFFLKKLKEKLSAMAEVEKVSAAEELIPFSYPFSNIYKRLFSIMPFV